jgi:uncharacterized repeat protein (TIGR01451 family)
MLAVLLLGAASVRAQDTDPVTAELTIFRVAGDAEGNETLTPVTEIALGDIVEYQVVYTNRTNTPIQQLSPLLPIPGELVFLPQTALPVSVLASTDGDRFAVVPLTELVVLPDGTKEEHPVPYSQYRILKWEIGTLNAGSSIQVRARMQVGEGLLSQNRAAAPGK